MKRFLLIMVAGMLLASAATAQGVSRLFGLVGGSPQSNQSSNGFLFSTDSSGNSFQVKYDFPVTVFGANPANVEMALYNGKLYGTTSRGGTSDYGTIFEYDPATNTYTKKFDFGPNPSVTGGAPKGSLLLYNNKFYGLCADYAALGAGCIFEWDPATNVYTKKFDFNGTVGANPQNSLRLYNGKMYGTTVGGGGTGIGVVFEWDPVTNVCNKLLEMNGTNGWGFYNNVTIYNGKIYCTSQQGAAIGYGALYVIDPSLPYGANTTIIKQFDGASGVSGNNNEMIVYNNKLYGCLNTGGAYSGGTLFEVDPATNTFTKLVDFNYTSSGANPQGKLVQNGATFLGLCSSGGVNGTGAVYEWDPANPTTVTRKYSFGVNNYDNPINPGSTLAAFGGKFYATTYNSSFVNQGALFEYDPATSTATKKLTFNAAENGRIPYGRPVLLNGQLYGICQQGPQEIFGSAYGCLWGYDPQTSTYSRRFLFDNSNGAANGRGPTSSPIVYNGKLYGVTPNGGTSDYGVLYEYDPTTSTYTKNDMQPIGGAFPISAPTAYNNKLYGMTNASGAGNNGIIYSYDPATGTLTKLYDVQSAGSWTPTGGFTLYNNKLYGATSGGGTNNVGGIIAYDPVANTATTLVGFLPSTGYVVNNPLTLYNNKLYGTAMSGGMGPGSRGCVFEFDPATNNYRIVYNFSTAPGAGGFDPKGELTVSGNKLYCLSQEGVNIIYLLEIDPVANTAVIKSTQTVANYNVPVTHNGLAVVPAFIADGVINSCQSFPVATIDATNNNKWVPILNSNGDVLAEIKANGNNLGVVSASVYINNGPVRENQYKQLYMDRNLTITTQNPIASGTVDIRLYVKTNEFLALKNAVNSLGQPSGINTINDVSIFKNNEACINSIMADASKIATTATPYEYGYVLSASISSFSSFYFASKTLSVLPVSLTRFDAIKKNNSVQLNWETANEINFAHYEIEKSTTGNTFSPIATVAANNNGVRNNYTINDMQPYLGMNYYRLKLVDKDGSFSYSHIVAVNFAKAIQLTVQPNPAHDVVSIKGLDGYQQFSIVDMAGRVLLQKPVTHNTEQVDISMLGKGVYFVHAVKGQERVTIKLFKD